MGSTAVAMSLYKSRQDEELCVDEEEALLGCPTEVSTAGVAVQEEQDETPEEAAVDDGSHDAFCVCCRGLITARLPQELLIEIFSLLPVRAVCLQAALTCRAWCSLTLDQALWQRLFTKHFEEELEDKANRFYHLRLRQELKWRQEFQHCVRTSSRDIKVYLRQQGTQRSEMAEVVVNVRDSMRKLLKKASRAFNIAVPQKLIFSFIEAPTQESGQRSKDDFELSYQHWLELEAHEERVIRSRQLPFAAASVGLEEINHVRRLFRHERRQQRQARLKYHQAMDARRHQRHTMAVVVVEDGDGPHQRVENNRLNPPIVTYYINALGPKDERVGHFLIDGCVGTCLLSRQFLIDM